MKYWIPVYVYSRKGMKKAAKYLKAAQLAEMDGMFRSACQGMDSPDMKRIYEQHRKKTLFYHISTNTGLRYHFEISKKKGTVSILSVDAEYGRLVCNEQSSRCTAAAS